MSALEDLRWGYATIEAYREPKDAPLWAVCPHCLRRPRVWIFDNGSHAKCQCVLDHSRAPYHAADVEAISILDVYRRDGNCIRHDPDLLRRLWNTHVEEEQGHTQ